MHPHPHTHTPVVRHESGNTTHPSRAFMYIPYNCLPSHNAPSQGQIVGPRRGSGWQRHHTRSEVHIVVCILVDCAVCTLPVVNCLKYQWIVPVCSLEEERELELQVNTHTHTHTVR